MLVTTEKAHFCKLLPLKGDTLTKIKAMSWELRVPEKRAILILSKNHLSVQTGRGGS